jgi:hypothetical protein
MKDPIGWRLVRWIYGAFYAASGVYMGLSLLGVVPTPDIKCSVESCAFQQSLDKTGFIMPAVSASYVISGVSLLFYRTAPLGIVILAPIMVVIFLTNVLLSTTGWIWGSGHAAVLAALAWHFRAAFRSLWNFSPARYR